ncbi:MAG: trehalase family glycosidase [Pseudomonadota bacterium]
MTDLSNDAIDVLRTNDRGGFTVPTARLYPFQWNWDSALTALGFATFDQQRAWQEIDTLLEGQWPDGMLPHIVFREPDDDYFPGPDVWDTRKSPASSGHSQPPVVTSVVLQLLNKTGRGDKAAELFPALFAYHQWYHNHRDPDATGVVATIHPWETGRDNCPDWDSGMEAVVIPDDLPAYTRRDTSHVDPAHRPSARQYDQFLSIVKFGRECQWDHQHIYRQGPFLMADPGIQFILLRADRDLLTIARQLGFEAQQTTIEQWIERSLQGCDSLWNAQAGGYCARNLKSGEFSDAITNASLLCFYAAAGNEQQARQMLAHATDIAAAVEYTFPSWDPRHPKFESQRYWRGPVWAIMNTMIAQGLAECRHADLASRVTSDTLQLIEKTGFCEYFDPLSGAGLGGDTFTWTAAMYLHLRDNQR